MWHIAQHQALRLILASISLLLFVGTAWSVWRAFSTTPDQIKTVPYYPQRAISFDMARKDIDGLFQTGVLLLAGLWGVGIVKKEDRLRWKDVPEVVMFVIATVLLLGFLYICQCYAQILERVYWDQQWVVAQGKIFPDLFDSPYIRLYHDSLFHCFYSALGTSAMVTLSLCSLRGTTHG